MAAPHQAESFSTCSTDLLEGSSSSSLNHILMASSMLPSGPTSLDAQRLSGFSAASASDDVGSAISSSLRLKYPMASETMQVGHVGIT